ncbi:hypothetical protein HFO06_04270 [Rhizobium leguminosarum]|uniref:hypothetical protein n=1 Tax=Rhizobium leguminosarum TaxID=384 RepID=UPI001C9467B5|nr:hypothetical protein [Rhizobium leguminosarum]MBY5762331.1 hypothetical protein [Rhizobium leguminosarum]
MSDVASIDPKADAITAAERGGVIPRQIRCNLRHRERFLFRRIEAAAGDQAGRAWP